MFAETIAFSAELAKAELEVRSTHKATGKGDRRRCANFGAKEKSRRWESAWTHLLVHTITENDGMLEMLWPYPKLDNEFALLLGLSQLILFVTTPRLT